MVCISIIFLKKKIKRKIERLVNLYIEPNSTIITDEHVSYKGIKNISDIKLQ